MYRRDKQGAGMPGAINTCHHTTHNKDTDARNPIRHISKIKKTWKEIDASYVCQVQG